MVITARNTKLKPGYKQTEIGVIPEDWGINTLKSIVENNRIPSGIYKEKILYGIGTKIIKLGDVFGGDYFEPHFAQRVFIDRKELLRNQVYIGDIIISLASVKLEGVGKVMYVNKLDEETAFDHNVALIRLNKDCDSEYIFYYLKSDKIRDIIRQLSTQVGTTFLKSSTIQEFKIPLPPTKHEQIAIATVLSDIDALITSLDRLITKKHDIKQATMQQLLTGRTRLPGFGGEREVKKFEEIFQFLNTANNSRSDLSENGEIKYIHYGDIHMKWRSFLDCSSNELPLIQWDKVKNMPFLEDGDLVMADASEDYEGIGISVEVKNATGKKVVAGLHTFLLRGDKDVLADGFKGYLQYIPAVKNALKKAATGISVYGISKNNIRNISICLPDITEQQAIAFVLSDMDAEIAALEQRRDKTRALKQGMMQELLTGKTRLV